jgi:hypothetical protein
MMTFIERDIGRIYMYHLVSCLSKALENRTKESKQEMDILDALEDIKDANSRSALGEIYH